EDQPVLGEVRAKFNDRSALNNRFPSKRNGRIGDKIRRVSLKGHVRHRVDQGVVENEAILGEAALGHPNGVLGAGRNWAMTSREGALDSSNSGEERLGLLFWRRGGLRLGQTVQLIAHRDVLNL